MNKKGMNPLIATTILLVVATLCVFFSVLSVKKVKNDVAEKAKAMPESAISEYLKLVKGKKYDDIYANSLIVDNHLNSKQDYIEGLENTYGTISVSDCSFQLEGKLDDAMLYNVVVNNKKIAALKLIKKDNTWQVSTIFKGNNAYIVEVPVGVHLIVNDIEVSDSFILGNNQQAMNFSGIAENVNAPKVVRYGLKNLVSFPTITTKEPGYNVIKDVLSNTYYVGKEVSDSTLESVFIDSATTLAKYPTKDTSLGAVSSISMADSDFYRRIKTLDNQWYAPHSLAQFSNYNVSDIVQQNETSMIGNISFDYDIASGSARKTYHCGYQMSFIKIGDLWKIAGFAIDNDLNPLNKK